MATQTTLPKSFFWRRVHSLAGLWLVLFLIEHLLTNSQAALLIGDDGIGFVDAVNWIHGLPYLPAIEIGLLAVPFLLHMYYGIHYLRTGEINSWGHDAAHPMLGHYGRNRAYTWQRVTSWILLFLVIGHVIQMRFLEYPASAKLGSQEYYMVRVDVDPGLYTVAARLGVKLYDKKLILIEEQEFAKQFPESLDNEGVLSRFWGWVGDRFELPQSMTLNSAEIKQLLREQMEYQEEEYLEALKQRPLKNGDVIAVAQNFGTAVLLMVRETFKSPWMIALYTIFVIAAVFHAFNGLWTFMITWGVMLTQRAQNMMLKLSHVLMILLGFLGLMAVWGTYWLNLKS